MRSSGKYKSFVMETNWLRIIFISLGLGVVTGIVFSQRAAFRLLVRKCVPSHCLSGFCKLASLLSDIREFGFPQIPARHVSCQADVQ